MVERLGTLWYGAEDPSNSKWLHSPNQERIRQRKENDGLRLLCSERNN